MASWKKVLVSGSSIEIAAVTSSATPTIGSIGSNYVVMIDPSTGYVSKITSGNFQASLGQYAYTASADTGTAVIIGSGDTLDVAGGLGMATAISTVAGGAEIAVALNTGSTHFLSGVSKEVFDAANFVDSSEVNFTVTAGTSVTAALINGSIANARLANSTISGVALGGTLNALTLGSGLTGTSYNGSGAVTTTVDSGSMLPYYSSSIFSRVSGDITINSSTGVAAIGSGVIVDADINASAAIAVSKLAASTISGITLGGTLNALTAGAGLTSAGTYTGATARTFTVDSSSMATYFRQNAYSNISGDITINSSGVAAIGSGVIVDADIANGTITNAKLANSSITVGSTAISLGSTATTIAGLASLTSVNITGSAISASGALTGGTITSATSITATAGNITATAGNIVTSAGYAQIGSNTTVPNASSVGDVAGQHGLFDLATIGTLQVSQDATITGNLTVNGTTTTINTTNLLVTDKFALFASGSDASTDGGIIVQQGATTGYALGVDASVDRWALQNNLGPTATTITPDSYMVTAVGAASAPSSAPVYGGSGTGYGNIHVNTSTGEIYIYS